MEIREARADELAAVGELTVAAYRAAYGRPLGWYEERLRDAAARASGAVVLVAVEGDRLVGCATYVPHEASPYAELLEPGEAGIRMVAVDPARMRLGVGAALGRACVDRARAEGKRSVALHADESRPASHALWRSLGFTRDPRRDFAPDEETTLWCYVLPLSGG